MAKKPVGERREFALSKITEESRRERDLSLFAQAIEKYYDSMTDSEREEERRWAEFADSELNKLSDHQAMRASDGRENKFRKD